MSDDVLDADARSLLDLGREQLGPDAETVARLRGRVETAVAVVGSATIAAGIASKLGLTSVKLAIVAMTVTTVTTIAVVQVVHRHHHGDPVVAPVTTRAAPSDRRAPSAAVSVTAPDAAITAPAGPSASVAAPVGSSPIAPGAAPVVPLTRAPRVASAPVGAAPAHVARAGTADVAALARPTLASAALGSAEPASPSRVVTAATPAASLARETELVDLATRALRANDLATLHNTLQLYVSEAGRTGQLAEEIAAIEIEALCRANDPTAPQRLAAFDARWPRAGQRHRLTDACKGLP